MFNSQRSSHMEDLSFLLENIYSSESGKQTLGLKALMEIISSHKNVSLSFPEDVKMKVIQRMNDLLLDSSDPHIEEQVKRFFLNQCLDFLKNNRPFFS